MTSDAASSGYLPPTCERRTDRQTEIEIDRDRQTDRQTEICRQREHKFEYFTMFAFSQTL